MLIITTLAAAGALLMFFALAGGAAVRQAWRERKHEGAGAVVYLFPSDTRNSASLSRFTEGTMIWECPECRHPATLVEDPYPWPDAEAAVHTDCCRVTVAEWNREDGETYPQGKPVPYPR